MLIVDNEIIYKIKFCLKIWFYKYDFRWITKAKKKIKLSTKQKTGILKQEGGISKKKASKTGDMHWKKGSGYSQTGSRYIKTGDSYLETGRRISKTGSMGMEKQIAGI